MARVSSRQVYQLAGVRIASAVDLSPLGRVRGAAAEWDLRMSRAPLPAARWFHRWYEPNGRLALSFGRTDAGYVLQFARSTGFEIQTAARWIRCVAPPGVPATTTRHLLLNQVLPMLLASPERLVLHGSAVALPEGVVAFVGPTGSGKSTLAAALAMRGWPLVTDDTLIIGQRAGHLVAWPGVGEVRLRADAAHGVFGAARVSAAAVKRGFREGLQVIEAPAPVSQVYLLGRWPGRRGTPVVAPVPVTPRDAVLGLVRCSFQIDIADRAARTRLLEQTAALVDAVDVCGLKYRRSLGALAEVASAIEARARRRPGGAGPTASAT